MKCVVDAVRKMITGLPVWGRCVAVRTCCRRTSKCGLFRIFSSIRNTWTLDSSTIYPSCGWRSPSGSATTSGRCVCRRRRRTSATDVCAPLSDGDNSTKPDAFSVIVSIKLLKIKFWIFLEIILDFLDFFGFFWK